MCAQALIREYTRLRAARYGRHGWRAAWKNAIISGMDSYQKYICDKAKKKREIMGATFFPRTPLVLCDASETKKMKLYRELMRAFDAVDLAVIVIPPSGKAWPSCGNLIRILPDIKRKAALETADFVLTFNVKGIGEAWEYSCVPIAPIHSEITLDYDPVKETGNGFFFKDSTSWEAFAAIIRGLETYRFPYDWENLILGIRAMNKTMDI